MGIVGFNFRSINAHTSEKKTDEKMSVSSVPNIDNIEKKDLNVPGLNDVLSIEFSFFTTYEPGVGEIKITGDVLYQTPDTERILKMWGEKKLDSKVAVDVLNTVFKKCLAKAISLADELRLPPPLTFPVVKISKEDKGETTEEETSEDKPED